MAQPVCLFVLLVTKLVLKLNEPVLMQSGTNGLRDTRLSEDTLCPKKVVHPTHGVNFVNS